MLPSMPVIFTRDSQDAFGNKIQPSTSYYNPGPSTSNQKKKQTEERLVLQIEKLNKVKENDNIKEKNEGSSLVHLNTYENALVSTYYNKIINRFNPSKSNVFQQFKDLLKNFDPVKETPIDLYKKVDKLFGNDNRDLVEEFLMFLTPGQATELGRFSEHLMLRKMNQFLYLLQKTFGHKPTTHKRIIRILTNSMKSCDFKELRAKVLPLLKSKPQLYTMFKMLLPDEEPFDFTNEDNADKVTASFLTEDNGFDVWEFDDPTENRRNLTVKRDVDTMYLQGRVFLQYGKMLKSTKVSYPYSKEPYRVHAQRLSPAQYRLSPPPSDDETSPRKKNNKTTKPATKRAKKTKNVIKDVNGNNKQADTKVLNVPDSVKGSKSKQNHSDKKSLDTLEKKDSKNKIQDVADKKEAKTWKQLDLAEKKDLKSKAKDNQKNLLEGSKANKVKQDSKHLDDKKEEPKSKKIKLETVKVKVTHQKPTKNESFDNKWTREEDKTMLETLQEEARSDAAFVKISRLLPHKSMTEIQDRFFYVMNLLQQMGVGEVT